MNAATKCEFCDKRGLPLLLVRDAVAPSKSGAPVAPSLPIQLAASAAHYTKRLLRSGYVNVFDEARKRWDIYIVTSDNYFFKTLQTPGVIPIAPAKPFNCPDEGHRAIASCITVSDPANATKVWIGFSDVLWTDAVRKANEDIAYRKRHMTEIDVKAVLKGNHAPHRPIAQLDAIVAEYAMEPSQSKATLGWSPFEFSSRYRYADRLKQECESLRPSSALIITLSDPSGIAQELAFLMKRNADLFIEKNPENRRNLAASAAIDQIEEAIRKQAEAGEIAGAEQIADQQIKANPLGHWLSESTRAQTENLRTVTLGKLKHSADRAWSKYASKFDDEARQCWTAPFSERLKAFDLEFIAPLALNHVSWMKSTTLADHFECNYDPLHPESGVVFTSAVAQCVFATQDKKACAALYDEWLGGDITDTSNLLLRAMILNQKVIAEAVKSATVVSVDMRQIPWDNIFPVATSAMARLTERAQEVGANLVAQVGGCIARIFNKVMDGSSGFRAAVMATGLISGHPVVVCDVIGTKRAFRAHLIRQLLHASGQVVSENQMKRAVIAEMKRQQIHGVSVEGSTSKRWVMVADKQLIARMPAGLSPQARANWLAKSIKTIEAVEELNLQRWRSVINKDVRSGVVTGILQVLSLTKLISDDDKSLANEKNDSSSRRYGGVAAIAATTSEAIGNALAARSALGMRFGQGFTSKIGNALKSAGRIAGLAAGLLVVGLDAWKAYKEYKEGADGLIVVSYIGSAVIGTCLSVAIFASAALPVIGILILLAIGIGMLIDNIKDNPIQDWLERCPWGKLLAQRYPDFDTQQAQLKQAVS